MNNEQRSKFFVLIRLTESIRIQSESDYIARKFHKEFCVNRKKMFNKKVVMTIEHFSNETVNGVTSLCTIFTILG